MGTQVISLSYRMKLAEQQLLLLVIDGIKLSVGPFC